jgi:uncharacterized coiled-coil DUF342 family protein
MTEEMSTKPTMETLLARMNEWGASITSELVEIKKGYAELRQDVEDLRKGQVELRSGLDELRKGLDELRKGQDELRKGQDEIRLDMNTSLYRVKLKIQGLNDTFLEMQSDIRSLNLLFQKLEAESLAPK